ncbi:MAG: ATP-binding cassette domain-containing protein [Lachnospiraceae bacterium]|nr:ATP-binding cassette domain-containing protein [Lachnospiraceae bacterium]
MGLTVDIKKEFEDFSLETTFSCKGKRMGILGASGCGKSMTLKSIAGLLKPDEGRIVFDDRIFFDSKKGIDIKADRRRVGYLFQNYALFPNMTVWENLKAAMAGAKRIAALYKKREYKGDLSSKKNKDKEYLKDILKRFGLEDVKDHRPLELSGGQQQRCALARMIITDPELLLLDEPFSAMDSFLKEGMRMELIRFLDEYDKTVILVSHDRDEVYQICDHLLLMDRGRIIEEGRTEDVFKHPGSLASARLTGCRNITAIEILSEHKIRALDWGGIELFTSERVTKDHRYAGIRAHDFEAGERGENIIPAGRASISKLPFEWYVTLENGLWWKLPKRLEEVAATNILPEYISIAPEKIILMKN